MTELSPVARALLDAARDGLSPDAAALRRVRGRVDLAVASGITTGAIIKLAIVIGVVAGVAIGALAMRSNPTLASPTLALPSPITVASEPEIALAHDAPAPAAAEPVAAPAPARRTAPSRSITLAREVELVDAAMTALRAGDPTTALAAVRIHREEARDRGQLAEDISAIEVESLCALGDPRVVAKLDAFDARWPESAQRSRLTTSCP